MQQCTQLTGTNRPIGFIRSGRRQTRHRRKSKTPSVMEKTVSCIPPGAAAAAAGPVGFPGLVATARAKHPIPSRTRPLSAAAPMVLRPKTRESRSPPNLISPRTNSPHETQITAGWSSPVARQAHNLKVVGSNPTPATRKTPSTQWVGGFFVLDR